MGAEGSLSGAIGTTGAGVALAAGPAIGSAGTGAEMSSGVGFDNGSPTFSGLGRSDLGNSSFSINEGPQGPVSFTNSTDLFAETKSVAAIDTSILEKASNIFNGNELTNTEVIATNPSLESKPTLSIEPVSMFDNTSPFQITMPVNESPVYAPEPVTVGVLDQPEISVESALESHLEVSPESLTQALDNLKTDDPLVYGQLKSDLESVDKIIGLVDLVDADSQTVANISNSAINTAVERSGIIQVIEETQTVQDETEEEFGKEPEIASEQNVQDDQRPIPQDSFQSSFVRDEASNRVRIENRHTAAEEALNESGGEVVEGKDIISRIEKNDVEQSGLAKKVGVEDGSISPADDVIKKGRVNNIQEADNLIYQAVKDNSGVTEGTSGPRATDEEKAKVAGKNLAKAA